MTAAPDPSDPLTTAGQRRHRRARLALPAQVETVTARMAGEIVSLSQSGACIRLGAGVPKIGSDVVVRCGAIDAFGTVVWSGEDRCGIRFDELLADALVVAARRASDRRPETLQAARAAAARAWAQGSGS